MAHLLPHVPYDPAETIQSFVNRLAAVHTGMPADWLLADLGLSQIEVDRGQAGAIDGLADAADVDPDRLRDGAIVVNQRYVDFRGE